MNLLYITKRSVRATVLLLEASIVKLQGSIKATVEPETTDLGLGKMGDRVDAS